MNNDRDPILFSFFYTVYENNKKYVNAALEK